MYDRNTDPIYIAKKRVWDAQYRAKNKKNIEAQIKAIQKANPEKYRRLHAEWKRRNPKRVKELSAKYRENHREELNRKNREYQRTHPEITRGKNHRRRALKVNAKGVYTSTQWIALCDKYHNRCLYCGKKKKLTPDHVVPLSKGGRNSIDNIQPLCGPCNSRKHTKTIDFRT